MAWVFTSPLGPLATEATIEAVRLALISKATEATLADARDRLPSKDLTVVEGLMTAENHDVTIRTPALVMPVSEHDRYILLETETFLTGPYAPDPDPYIAPWYGDIQVYFDSDYNGAYNSAASGLSAAPKDDLYVHNPAFGYDLVEEARLAAVTFTDSLTTPATGSRLRGPVRLFGADPAFAPSGAYDFFNAGNPGGGGQAARILIPIPVGATQLLIFHVITGDTVEVNTIVSPLWIRLTKTQLDLERNRQTVSAEIAKSIALTMGGSIVVSNMPSNYNQGSTTRQGRSTADCRYVRETAVSTGAGSTKYSVTIDCYGAASGASPGSLAFQKEIVVAAFSTDTGNLYVETSSDGSTWYRVEKVVLADVSDGTNNIFYGKIVHRPTMRYVRMATKNTAGSSAVIFQAYTMFAT